MRLNRDGLEIVSPEGLVKPNNEVFDLPERVLQFGTGVLLRGLPDYFIDKANRQGIFNGRIVVVKSTDTGNTRAFDDQDNLYTLCVRGYHGGSFIESNTICSAISRVLSASTHWSAILDCASNPELKVIISNTTESGIVLVEERIDQGTPVSFPGKLLAFLYKRYQLFQASIESGMVIVPTELIPDNGAKLYAIVLELARQNGLDDGFMQWMKTANHFCNSLVDRIVPGTPDAGTLARLEQELGYKDDLLIMAEPYRLWAIEGPEKLRDVLSFHQADAGVVIHPDINKYRELKLRLLNGTHTLCCGLALLQGFKTVAEAMADDSFLGFVTGLMQDELSPAIPYEIHREEKEKFCGEVIDRFRNPSIDHRWLNITMNYSSKMRTRNVATLLNYYASFNETPQRFALGFAAYLRFMKAVKQEAGAFYGEIRGEFYRINDDNALYFKELWAKFSPASLVGEVLRNQSLWGHNLSLLPGLEESVRENLIRLDAMDSSLTSVVLTK